MRTVRSLLLAAIAGLSLVGCSSASGEEAAPTTNASAEATADQQTCLEVGRVVVGAQVPLASTPPVGQDAIDLDRRLITATGQLQQQQATGELGQGIDALTDALGQMTAVHAVDPWAERRDHLTQVITDVQATCRGLGVPDFLNP